MLAQGGTSLYKVDLTTGVATTLTLPTGVTLSSTRKAKFAVLNHWIVMVNSPSKNLAIDAEGNVRVLVPSAPTFGPTLATGGGSGLTGDYSARTSFIVTNSDGELLMESPLSPVSATLTTANQDISYSDVSVSLDAVTARRIYRSTADGSTYFHLMDVDGNSATGFINGLSDASLSLLAVIPTSLASPPGTIPGVRFKNIIEWKSRLWAIPDAQELNDTVYVSETNKVYTFPNTLVAHPTGLDVQGLVGFAPRRNQLGLLKRTGLWVIAGSASGTGVSLSNVNISQITSGKAGCISPESIVAVNDRVYWLGTDGVFEWTDEGVQSISDTTVAPWFKGDTYFNRSRFGVAFGKYNELRNQYELHLASAGSSVEDRWVAFNLTSRRWFGPHKTDQLTPTLSLGIKDGNDLPLCLVGGSDGVVYTANSALMRDGSAHAIDFDCYGPFHHGDDPDIEHYWGELSILSKVEAAGTLTVTPTVGRLDAVAQDPIFVDLTKGRQRLRRLGKGAMARLRLQHNTINQSVTPYGLELYWHELGRR